MPVRNCLKPVLEEKLKLKKLTGYKFGKLTGLGRATSERIHDPNWIPNERTLEIICKTFRIQPGEFLYWVPDESDSIRPLPKRNSLPIAFKL
jgi:DNA-binding Xre family transcriptional regulator